MKHHSLKDQIQAYYREQELPKDRLEHILSLGHEFASHSSSPKMTKNIWVRSLQWGGLAAMLVIGLMIGSNFNFSTTAIAEVTDFVLEDVAQSHRLNLEPEVWNDSLHAIQLKMDRLDSSCQRATLSQLPEGFVIIGARYCQLQSVLAMQIRLINPDTNERITLYIAPRSRRLETTRIAERQMNGVHVRIWHDEERVYAIAKSISGL